MSQQSPPTYSPVDTFSTCNCQEDIGAVLTMIYKQQCRQRLLKFLPINDQWWEAVDALYWTHSESFENLKRKLAFRAGQRFHVTDIATRHHCEITVRIDGQETLVFDEEGWNACQIMFRKAKHLNLRYRFCTEDDCGHRFDLMPRPIREQH